MEEIIERWYEIPVYKLIQEIKDKHIPDRIINDVPLTNFNIEYRFSSGMIHPVIGNVYDHFTVKCQSRVENTLEMYLTLNNPQFQPNAKLRFKKNIVEEINNFISLSK